MITCWCDCKHYIRGLDIIMLVWNYFPWCWLVCNDSYTMCNCPESDNDYRKEWTTKGQTTCEMLFTSARGQGWKEGGVTSEGHSEEDGRAVDQGFQGTCSPIVSG